MNKKLRNYCGTVGASSIPEVPDLAVYSSTMPSKTSPSEVTWNPGAVHALGLCKMQTQILGLWPLNNQNLFAKARLFVAVVFEVSMAINLIREMNGDCVRVDEIMGFLGFLTASMMALLKVTVLRLNQGRMELLIRSALEDWSKVEDVEARGIMRKHASTGRFVFIFQMSCAYITVVPLMLIFLSFNNEQRIANTTMSNDYNYSSFSASSVAPFLLASSTAEPQRGLPMGTECFVADLPTVLYVLVYISQIIQLMITCAGNIGTDVYFFSVALHVCAQFELLKISFETFGQNPDPRNCREEFEKLVKRHNRLITLSNIFEDTFNPVILVQLSANTLHMSLLGLQLIISMNTGNGVVAINSLIAISILSLQLFLFSYVGDYLTTQTEKLRDAVYCCSWYDLPPKLVKDLIFVMTRSNFTFHLTAGKVYCMNIENFKNIIKAMASYFSMLRLVFDE